MKAHIDQKKIEKIKAEAKTNSGPKPQEILKEPEAITSVGYRVVC